MSDNHAKTCALRSGSSGNAIFVGSGETRILIDVGVCCRTIEQALTEINEEAAALNGILVTHEHADHIAGLGALARRYNIPVYANQATWKAMRTAVGRIDDKLVRVIETGGKAVIGDMAISSFATPHDAAEPVGYRIETAQGAVSVFTDVGSLQEGLLQSVAGCRIVYVEANYDYTMLMAGTYPAQLKSRIVGQYGHLSNDDCATAVCRLLESGTSHFVLSHISKDNNYPELALLTVDCKLQSMGAKPGQDLRIGIAQRYAVSETVCL